MADNFWEKDTIVKDENEWWSQDKIAQQPAALTEEDRDSTIGSELVRGGKQLASSIRTSFGAFGSSPEEAARAGVQRSEAIAEEAGEGASLEAVKRAYREKGLLSAAGEVIDQAPRALASQAAQLALMAGGAKTGAVAGAPFGPVGSVVGGALGAGATLLPQLFGSNIERQASEQMARDEEVDINRLAAGAGAVGQAAIETAAPAFILGKRLVKSLIGVTDDADLITAKAKQDVVDAANRSLLYATGRGVARGAAIEIPIEIASSVIERAQAGLDVTSPDALAEYGEVAYQAALVGGSIGGISSPIDTVLARQNVEKQPPEAVAAFEREREEFVRGLGPQQELPPGTVPVDAETDVDVEVEPPTEFPGGYTATRRELSRQDVPESYGIFPEGADKPLTTVQTQEEAQAKLQTLTEIRAEEQARLIAESDKIDKEILAERRKLDVLEATGQTDTDQYVQSKAALLQREEEAAQQVSELNDRIASYSTPLTLAPVGSRTDVQSDYVVRRGDQEIGAFPTLQDAELKLREIEPEPFKQAEQQAQVKTDDRVQQLKQTLTPMLAKFGLQDVSLNIAEKIENDAGGKYLDKLINVSLTEANPVQTMRHESLHALKDLQFFTPQQWKALTERANKQWIKEYLQDQQSVIEVDGKPQTMSRLDAYKKLGYTQEAIVEEAIADAFGAYDKGATPPPGMIAALFKKLKNFFLNFGQALRGAGFESADDVFQRVERGELKSRKPKAEAKTKEKLSLPIMRGEEVPKFEGPPKAGKTEPTKLKPTVDSVGKYFDDQVIERNGSKLDYTDKASFDRAVKLANEEVAYQIKKENSGLDWYEEDVKDAFKQTKKLIPELGKEHNRLLFSVMAGIMSPSTTARDNWFIAAKGFQHYLDTGVIPSVNPETGVLWMGGPTSANKKTQLDFLNNMVNDMGQKKALEWLFTDHTIKEINSFRSKYGNIKSGIDGKLTDMRPALYAFGPKVGPFVANLNGIPDVTVDKWMTRTFNRYFGTMLNADGKIVDAPTEPQRRAIKALINEVAKNAGIKPYQAQSLLWFYEQQLFTKIGANSPSYGFSDGAKKFVDAGGGGGKKGVSDAAAQAGEKLSLRKGVVAEVAPNPDHISAKKWREMTPSERLNATKAVANRVVSSVFSELDLKGYKYEFSTGTYEGEVNPNIIVQAPEGATEQELDEVARVLGYVLDQKAMVAFDEDNKSSSDQAGFVKVVIPTGMSPSDLNELRTHITQSVPQADGDTLRDGELVYGNFSAYNDNVDTLTDKQYHKAIRDAVEAFPYEGIIEVSAPETFHSSLIWPDTRSDYLKETRYGDSERFQGEAGADVRGQRSRRLQAISEDAISLRDKWIDARGAARLGGRERGAAIDFGQPTEDYGTPTRESVSVIGVHFSKEGRSTLISEFHGTGLRGLEGERLSERENSDIRSRIYFYVDNGKGVRPEAGVGGTPHVIRLRNLYDASADPLDIIKNTKGDNSAERASKWERSVKKAGFDGYLVKNQAASQDYAVLIGKHSVKTGKLSLRTSFPSAKEAENAAYDKAPPSTKEFKLFFGGSTIMDEGRAVPMFHGSQDIFTQFRENKPIFVSPNAEEAERYGGRRAEKGESVNVYPLWVRAETPFDYQTPEHVQMVMDRMAKDKTLKGKQPAFFNQGHWENIEDKQVQDAIKALGFDSFFVNEGGEKNLAVFKAEQVKSITGNIGDFSRESKDMRFSLKKVRYSPDRFDKLWSQSMYTQSDADNKTKGYLAFVNPLEFVNATASPDDFDRLRREQEPLDVERLKAYDQVPFLTVSEKNGNWKITGHEGRHRMLALYDDGYREVPVYIHLRAEDAKSIPVKALTAQYDDSLSSVLMVAEVEPLSYANKQRALEKFTRMESKVKYSLPTIPQNLQDRMGETTSRRERKTVIQNIIDAITPTSAADFRAKYLNRYNQMSVYDKKLAEQMGGAVLLADQSAESSALMSDLGAGVAASAMGFDDRNGGIPVLRNGITTIDKSVKGLIASLGPLAAYGDPAIYQRYQYWAMVKRGQRLNKEGKLTGIDSADVAFAKILEQAHPEFVSVQKDLIAFNNGLVQYMVDTGVLSKERGQIYTKYADYIPFYRQMDGGETQGPNLFQSLSGVKPPKKLKGAIAEEAPLADFLETMVRNTQSSIQAGIKNYAAQRALNVAVQVKAPGMQAQRLNYVDKGPDIINVLEKGNLVSYRTTDTLLVNAMMSLNQSELPFIGFLSAPADLLRTLVTKEPGFMMANMLRDSLSAWVTSGQKMTPIAGTVINFGKALARKSPGFEAMLDAGIIGGYEFNENVEKSGFKLEDDLAKKAGKKAPIVLRPFKSVWDALGKGTTASDAATRALIYERVLADTGNEAEALYRSLEVMNFHRKGSSPLIRVLTAAVPFFNARLQGLDLFYRASTGNMNNKDAAAIQRQFFARGMTMMALSGLYWMLVSDDEEYKKQEQETKDNNWIIPAIGAKIPIPFEVGVLFKVIPERIMAYSFGDDTGEDLQKSMIRAAVSTFAFNPIPQTVKPVLEAVVDYNMFTMRPILGQGMKDIEPEFQVGPSTSNFATLLAQNLGLSPMKVDHIIKGYTGTMGMYAIDTIDIMLDQFGDSPKPTKRFEQLPVIKRFASDPESRGFVTQYYELKDAVDTTVRTMNLLERTGQYEEYAEYLVKNQGTLAFKGYVRDTEKTLKDLREMRTAIRSSTMTGDEKRDSLLEISRVESAITANIQEIKKAIAQAQ
jgi:hypothetical protein